MQKASVYMNNDYNFIEHKKKSLEKLSKSKDILQLLNQYGLSVDCIEESWSVLLNYQEDVNICKNCPGLKACPKSMTGYKEIPVYDGFEFHPSKKACQLQEQHEKQREILNNVQFSNVTYNIFKDDFMKIKDITTNGFVACSEYLINQGNGFYLYGETQTGKTRLMGLFAYRLARMNKQVAFVNVPSLMADLKASFNKSDFNSNELINSLKDVEVLILDDIGGENFSTWSRDEVILNILSSRVLSELPTFFTSVHSIDSLIEYYGKNGDLKNSKRLGEMIRKNHNIIEI